MTPWSVEVRCIEPPLPRISPISRCISSPKTLVDRHAAGERVGMAAIGAEAEIALTHGRGEAGGDRLLAERQMACALDQVLQEEIVARAARSRGSRPACDTW